MNERVVTYSFNNVAALAANYLWYAELPFGFTLTHISAVASNATDGNFKVGKVGADDVLMGVKAIGKSGTPASYGPGDFTSRAPHLDKGEVLLVTVDFDGSAGTAAQNLQVVITGLIG